MKKSILWLFGLVLGCLLGTGQARAAGSVQYVERSWNETTRTVDKVTKSISTYNDVNAMTWSDASNDGWYVAQGSVTINANVTVSGDVKLILTDGCSLTVMHCITVNPGNSLTIYGQSGDSGSLTAYRSPSVGADLKNAGIGGSSGNGCGDINIHGGMVSSSLIDGGAFFFGAAIGGGEMGGQGGTITVYGGTVTAENQLTAIGCGSVGNGHFPTAYIKIYGGTVNANSSKTGAGIGGFGQMGGSDIQIYGGTVNASSKSGCAIGGNMTMIESPVALSSNKVTISGGTVTALQGGITGQYFSTGENGNAVVITSNINMSKQCSMDNGLFILPEGGGIRGYDSWSLTQDVTIPAGYTFAINDGQTLNVAGGVTLTNNGIMGIAGGTCLTGSGTLAGSGEFLLNAPTGMPTVVPATLTYNRQNQFNTLQLQFPEVTPVTVMGQEFTLDKDQWSIQTVELKNAGKYELTLKNGITTVTATVTVEPVSLAVADATAADCYKNGLNTARMTQVTLNGILDGDNVGMDLQELIATLSGYTEKGYTTADLTGATLTGADAPNYMLPQSLKEIPLTRPVVLNEVPQQADGVYRLATASDLYWFAALVNGDAATLGNVPQDNAAKAVLTADITIPEGKEWLPIAPGTTFSSNASTVAETTNTSYSGTFDGQGHTISNLAVRSNSTELTSGLFGSVTGTIRNLGIVNANFNNGGAYDGRFGAICGLLVKDGQTTTEALVQNCFVINSSIKTKDKIAGAIVGGNYGGTIANCYEYNNSIEGYNRIGNLVGDNQNDNKTTPMKGTVSNCYSNVKVVGTQSGTVENSEVKKADQFASGEVTYLLNNSTSDSPVWYQNIDADEEKDALPMLDDSHGIVYKASVCMDASVFYSNSPVGNIHSFNENGFCAGCGGYQPAESNESGVYEISNAGQLFWFAALVNGDNTHAEFETQNTAAKAVLTTDIDIPAELSWTPTGNASTIYTGTFDGADHTISGMNIENAENYSGLFGNVTGTVKNFTVTGNITLTGSESITKVGGVVGSLGTASAGGTLSGVTSGVNITVNSGNDHIGGVVGSLPENSSPTVENCVYTGNINVPVAAGSVAGVAGYIRTGYILNCANRGTVSIKGTGNGSVGGILGYCNNGKIYIRNCYNSGTISAEGTDNVGAIVGQNKGTQATVSNCYYQDGSASKGQGQLATDAAGTVVKTAGQFVSGEVACLLQGDQTVQTWGQAIGTDDYPVLTTDEAKRVYAAKLYNGSADKVSELYTNASGISLPEGNAILVIEDAVSASTGTNVVVKNGGGAYTCANLVLTAGADFYTPVTFTAGKATYSRTLPETSTWGTIVLPFEATTTDANLYEATDVVVAGSEESILAVQPVTGGALEANTPALFQGETAGTAVTFSASDVEVAATADAVLTKTIGENGYTLTGSLSTIDALSEGDLFIAKDMFWSVGTTNKVGMQAFRAYIDAPEAGPAQVNALRILVGDATSIRQALSDGTLPVDVYNLQGVQLRKNVARDAALEGLPAGIYIVGGKKVVKK